MISSNVASGRNPTDNEGRNIILDRKGLMPELPEAETIRIPIAHFFTSGTIEQIQRGPWKDIWIEQGTYPAEGLFLYTVKRNGKILIFDWRKKEDEPTVFLVSRLGMSGTWMIQDRRDPLPNHSHLVFFFKNLADCLIYRDPRRFGRLEWVSGPDTSVVLASQGPDILTIAPDEWYARIRQSSRTIRTILLDQKVAAGVGNIYASEILFEAGLSPFRAGSGLSRAESRRILDAAHRILESAIQNGGSTIHSFRTSLGEIGHYQERHKVYGRAGKPCFHCEGHIKSVMEASRHLFYCPFCQKRRTRSAQKLPEILTTDQLPVS